MDVVLRKGYLGEGFGEGNMRGLTLSGGWRIHFCVFLGVPFKATLLSASGGPLWVIGSILQAFGEHLNLILVTFSGSGSSLKTYVLVQ